MRGFYMTDDMETNRTTTLATIATHTRIRTGERATQPQNWQKRTVAQRSRSLCMHGALQTTEPVLLFM